LIVCKLQLIKGENVSVSIKQLTTTQVDFEQQLTQLLAWDNHSDDEVFRLVSDILRDVRLRGDTALIDYTQRFDKRNVKIPADLEITKARLEKAITLITPEQKNALEQAAQRIKLYHQKQLQISWQYEEANGTVLGQQINALEKVGIYVPGGKAAYPSSVLMNAIPAKVAGVENIIMVVPTPGDEVNELVLAAAAISGVDRVFTVGGAQAIAALAYGTQTIPAVDKIVGPGNMYVATAKRLVFGRVGIDMIAGPSEILVVCDGKTDPDWIAMDLFSQAEHDEQAQSILLCPDANFIEQVKASMDKLLAQMPRADIIRASLQGRGALIRVDDIDQAIKLVNRIAPEHVELSIENAQQYLPRIKNAGAIFVGRHTSESLGDYCAGPNHVLPTAGSARFSSPLGVYDFQKRSSIINCSEQGAVQLGKIASVLAYGEGLTAHARSAEYRIK
jgi:histidinol dehydrogenase